MLSRNAACRVPSEPLDIFLCDSLSWKPETSISEDIKLTAVQVHLTHTVDSAPDRRNETQCHHKVSHTMVFGSPVHIKKVMFLLYCRPIKWATSCLKKPTNVFTLIKTSLLKSANHHLSLQRVIIFCGSVGTNLQFVKKHSIYEAQ